MSPTEQEKLKMRIEHWIEHNAEHAEEFKELAAGIKNSKDSVSAELNKAADDILKANKSLEDALKKLGKK